MSLIGPLPTNIGNNNKVGSIERAVSGEIDVKLFMFKNGRKLQTSEGNDDLSSFLRGFEVYESLTQACMEMRLILEDSAGILQTMTGSEEFALSVKSSIIDRTYRFRCYQIDSRVRTNQFTEIYLLNLVSDEYVRNEVMNVFGNSETIFQNKTEATEIIKTLMGKKYINTGKKIYMEETLNKQTFISPNWRPFDLIYWLSQRSIRKSGTGQKLQNGFAFFENALGFHFKSIDTLIDRINDQSKNETDPKSELGDYKLYEYTYAPKKVGTLSSNDQFLIDGISFPKERDYLVGLRNGTWSGYSVGFDPTFITRSRFGISSDLSADAYRYAVKDSWKRMSHLNGSGAKNPQITLDTAIQNVQQQPKRVRYEMIPNQIFDPKFKDNPQRNYEQIVELQAYQWMRIETLKNIQLTITVPGNLDLYTGGGIVVKIPSNLPDTGAVKVDKKYSGRYIIVALAHKSTGSTLTTELQLMKDSLTA
tara:strand:- start:11701 stop:13131 length:1431 start_codon:yes stop_codon:yes gene_type:complete